MPKPVSRRPLRLQEPEEVLNLTQRLLAKLRPYLKWIIGGGAGLLLILAGWSFMTYQESRREAQAATALAQVRPKLEKPEAAAEAIKALEQIQRDYPGAKAAREAELFRAHLLYQTKKFADAAKAYEGLRGLDPAWDHLINESLSYCYEGLGEFQKAAAVLQPLAEKTTGPLQTEVWRRLGYLWEKAGNIQEAAKAWKKMLERPPTPAAVPYLKEKLAASEAATPPPAKESQPKK